ncbi:hypothetical protein [Kibdelosporangium phytohabitans]|uniref:Uncharacterized protein n=1 Tax=Kibdelosporangium phytohabitans TaxID=860235 RepID=A0A0N9I1B3_9PSEU|nr:hypothetical protein [Kibdelosporangium phytohabitans]ALG13651.1 hypothetical protein AOZ06_48415 [Kibdelosporangium phytohabitans]
MRTRAEQPTPLQTPSSAGPAGPVACKTECKVVAATTLADSRIELVVDANGQGARLRIGDDRVVESRLPGRGAVLGEKSLVCVASTLSACLIKGSLANNLDSGTVGEVVVSRSGKWNTTSPIYYTTTEHQSLVNVNGDAAPELVAVQRGGSGFFVQVFSLEGGDLGCTPTVAKLDRLPGWPDVKPDQHQLKPCS